MNVLLYPRVSTQAGGQGGLVSTMHVCTVLPYAYSSSKKILFNNRPFQGNWRAFPSILFKECPLCITSTPFQGRGSFFLATDRAMSLKAFRGCSCGHPLRRYLNIAGMNRKMVLLKDPSVVRTKFFVEFCLTVSLVINEWSLFAAILFSPI